MASGSTILVKCFARCETEGVLNKLGLELVDLFPPRDSLPPLPFSMRTQPGGPPPGGKKIVAEYDYRDAAGNVVFQKIRYEPKDFRQRRSDGKGGWVWSLKGIDSDIPYHLDKISATQPGATIYVVEGEKDADRLLSLGLLATCSTGGAESWTDSHSAYLAGHHVAILPDNDPPGRLHAEIISKSLLGVAASVKTIELPGLPNKGDVSDWLDTGGTAQELESIYDRTNADGAVVPVKVIPSSEFFSVEYRREYIIDGILTAGEPCIIGGRSKTLKTNIAIEMALAIGTGGYFLGKFPTRQKTVALLSGESGDYTIQESARRIARSYEIDPSTARVLWGFELPCIGSVEGLESLEAMIVNHQVEVLMIDPVYLSLMGEATKGLNSSNLFDIGPLLLRIATMCKSHATSLILLHHCRKNSQNEKYSMPELEELSMSGFGEFARQWLLLGRRSQYLHDGKHELWMSVGGSAGHSGAWALDVDEGDSQEGEERKWEVTLIPAQEANEKTRQERERRKEQEREAKLQAKCDQVVKLLTGKEEGETERAIRDELGYRHEVVKSVVDRLESDGIIELCEVTRANRKNRGWKLVVPTPYEEFSDEHLDSIFFPAS